MLLTDRIWAVLNRVAYLARSHMWGVELRGAGALLQFRARCGAQGMQGGRKFYVSAHATDSEIIQTALLAVLAFEEHEAREAFRVDGIAAFSPHWPIDALVAAADEIERAGRWDQRSARAGE